MIHCRIQAHPSRAHHHDRLVSLLEPLTVEVMLHSSDPPDPWANYKNCIAYDGDATHLVVMQDDAVPAAGFATAAEKIAARWPDTPVCLFCGALPSPTASLIRRAKPDVRYVPLILGSFMPLVAVMWPTHVAREFLDWSDGRSHMTRADDGNAARWRRATKTEVMVTVPSIVQHNDDIPSTTGRHHDPWQNRWRYALQLAANASDYDW